MLRLSRTKSETVGGGSSQRRLKLLGVTLVPDRKGRNRRLDQMLNLWDNFIIFILLAECTDLTARCSCLKSSFAIW